MVILLKTQIQLWYLELPVEILLQCVWENILTFRGLVLCVCGAGPYLGHVTHVA